MKNLFLITVMLTGAISANAIETNSNTIEVTAESGDTLTRISATRNALEEQGYDSEMIDVLFGLDNFYFPTTKKELDLTIYIIDAIIGNEQYKKSDKVTLVALANDAFKLFKSESSVSEMLRSPN